jgi:hypothetical protein
MKTKHLIIVLLVCANVVLGALAAGLYLGRAETAAVAQSNSRGGDYLMASGPISSTRDAILIIDTVASRANLYVPKAGIKATGVQWELVDSRNLAMDFGRGAP